MTTIAEALEKAGMVEFKNSYAQIPEHMQAALRRYVLEGIQPGDFLTGVITNDLKRAVGHADAINLPLLKLYVQWFYNIAPGFCWGSTAIMREWMNARQQERVIAPLENALLEQTQRSIAEEFKFSDPSQPT